MIICEMVLFGMITFGIIVLNERIKFAEKNINDKIDKVYKIVRNCEDDLKWVFGQWLG